MNFKLKSRDEEIDEFNTVGMLSTISKNELLVTNEKGIVQRLFCMIFFSVLLFGFCLYCTEFY